jgi:hypothetical protein
MMKNRNRIFLCLLAAVVFVHGVHAVGPTVRVKQRWDRNRSK